MAEARQDSDNVEVESSSSPPLEETKKRQRAGRFIPSYISQSPEPVLCVVCGDKASGYHYNVMSCEGCKGFFRRTVQTQVIYECGDRSCEITTDKRTKCNHCRFKKCIDEGMVVNFVKTNEARAMMKNLIAENRAKKRSEAPAELAQTFEPAAAVTAQTEQMEQQMTFLSDIKGAYRLAYVETFELNRQFLQRSASITTMPFVRVPFDALDQATKFLISIDLIKQMPEVDQTVLINCYTQNTIYMRAILYYYRNIYDLDYYRQWFELHRVEGLIRSFRELTCKFHRTQLYEVEVMLLPLVTLVNNPEGVVLRDPLKLEQIRRLVYQLLPERWSAPEEQCLISEVYELSKRHDVIFNNCIADQAMYLYLTNVLAPN